MKEELYEQRLAECADEICKNQSIRLVLIAGGSCAGKTTTTRKLSQLIRERGRPVDTISLDDYYRNPENAVYLPNGKPDIEGLGSLRLDLLQETMYLLSVGKPAPIPFYDFTTKRRTDAHRILTPVPGGITIVEGLHALNPAICAKGTAEETLFRIYLYSEPEDHLDGRLLRRLVRDSRYRAADAKQTFDQWDTVRSAEKETIEPFAHLADAHINTHFDYERSILADDAIALLGQLPPEHSHAAQARELIEALKDIPLLPDSVVPEDSLLREFI